jgi:hypothetical protein
MVNLLCANKCVLIRYSITNRKHLFVDIDLRRMFNNKHEHTSIHSGNLKIMLKNIENRVDRNATDFVYK